MNTALLGFDQGALFVAKKFPTLAGDWQCREGRLEENLSFLQG